MYVQILRLEIAFYATFDGNGGLAFFSLKIVVLPSSSIVNGCFKTCPFFGDYKSIQRGIMHHNDVQRTQAHILTFKV